MRYINDNRAIKKRRILMVTISIITLSGILWIFGHQYFEKKWDFYNRGGGSTEKIEKFYAAVAQKDTTTFLTFFSKKILEYEKKDEILSAFKFGALSPDTDIEKYPLNYSIDDEWLQGDTALIQVNLKRTNSKQKRVNIIFHLIKENGEWKITFPE